MRNLELIEKLKLNEGKEVEIKLNSGEVYEGGLISVNHLDGSNEVSLKMSGVFIPKLCMDRVTSVIKI